MLRLVAAGAIVVGIVVLSGIVPLKPAAPPLATGRDSLFMSFGPDVYDFVPGSEKTIGGVALRLTADGDFQVVDHAGVILWRTDTRANCRDDCRVILQRDGNLVLSGPEGVLWSSDTWGTAGATMIFQPRKSYITIRDADYNVVWTSDGNNATAATGVLSDVLSGPRAVPVQAFLDSLAVNTHMDQYESDVTKVYDKLNYLGVRTIRDHYAEDGRLRDSYAYLAQRGIRFDMVHYSSNFDVLVRDAGIMASMPNDALIAVEGPNEINNFPFTCDGSTWQGGWPNNNGPAAQCFMQNYFDRIKGDSRFGGVSVYNLTGGTSVGDPDRYGLLSLSGRADFGNIHPYPSASEQPRGALLRELGSDYLTVTPSRAVITESGYSTSEISQRAQAIYYLNLYLDAFQTGFNKTYIYELTDNDRETHGFYAATDEPKASATALHNLTTILADSGPPREGTLEYSLTDMPKEVHSLAMQRSDGGFDLVLWDERPIWNGADIQPEPAMVNIAFKHALSQVLVYKPLGGVDPVHRLSGTSSMSLELSGEPLVLKLTP